MGIQNLTGHSLGQYELRELLGVGGMGAVYRARQASLKREVAVKILSSQLAQQSGYLDRFTREAETAAALEHTHIIPIYDYGMQQGISYVVMRLLTGGTLADRMQTDGTNRPERPSLTDVADLLKQIASGLDYAHSKGVIHRDIKPSNIMFDNQGCAYIVDFGIAKLAEATHVLTQSGVAMGTPSYMSPEQWKAENIGAATDQYAAAVMVYFLVTGRHPFEAPTPFALMNKHLNDQPTPPQLIRPDVPEAITQVLTRAMAKRADDRFPTATAFSQAFERAIQGQAGPATTFFSQPVSRRAAVTPSLPSVPRSESTQRRIPILAGLFALLVLVAGGILAAVLLVNQDNKKTGGTTDDQRETQIAMRAQTVVAQTLTTQGVMVTPRSTSEAMLFTVTALSQTESGAGGEITPTLSPVVIATKPLLVTPELEIQSATAVLSETPLPTQTSTPTLTLTSTKTPEPTLTATYTPSPTKTFTPTATYTASPTASPTHTPQPTATHTPQPTRVALATMPTATIVRNVVMRAGPNASYAQVSVVDADQEFQIIGQSEDGRYYQVTDGTVTGWVSMAYVRVSGDLSAIPTVSVDAPTATIVRNVVMRAGPSPFYDQVSVVDADQEFEIIGRSEDGRYYQVTDGNQTGWISVAYVRVSGDLKAIPTVSVDAPTATIVRTVVMRAGPDPSYEQVGVLNAGQKFEIIGRSEDGRYYQVTDGTVTGWVSTSYIRAAGETGSLPVIGQ